MCSSRIIDKVGQPLLLVSVHEEEGEERPGCPLARRTRTSASDKRTLVVNDVLVRCAQSMINQASPIR